MGVAVFAACGAGVLPAEGVVVVLEPGGLGVVEVLAGAALAGAALAGGVAVLAGPGPGARVEADGGRLALVGLMSKTNPTLDRSPPGGLRVRGQSSYTGGVHAGVPQETQSSVGFSPPWRLPDVSSDTVN